MDEKSCLPPFEFSSGYTLECIDMADIGVKITLKRNGEEDRAILLPPEECDRLLNWQQHRIGKRTSVREIEPGSTLCEGLFAKVKQQTIIIENITSDIEIFYEIIENDIGVTADEIREHKSKKPLVVFSRHLLYFILRLRFKLSMPKIATILGAKSHTSPFLALRKFNTSRIKEGFYAQSDLLKIYEDAKRRYHRTIIFNREGVTKGD